MKYIIIGLGNYGGVLAEELSALGHEVIGADTDASRVDNLKEKIATAFVLDATDTQALDALPFKEVDVVVVAIGEDLGASVRVVALLKQRQIPHIYARAVDPVHRAILEAFDVDKVLTPESDAARELVQVMALNIQADAFRLDEEFYVIKFKVPARCVGYQLNELNLAGDFHLQLIALKKTTETKNFLGLSVLKKKVETELPLNYILQENDEMICYGRYKDFQAFWKAL